MAKTPSWKKAILEHGRMDPHTNFIKPFLPLLLCSLADIGKTKARILRFLTQVPSDGCKDQKVQKAGATW